MSDVSRPAADAPRLHFALQVGVAWSERLHRSGVPPQQVAAAVTDALTALLSELGVPAVPELKVAVSAADASALYESAEPRLILEAQPLRYPRDLAERVTGGDAESPDVAAALAAIAREIVRLHAARLVNTETAAAYLASGDLSHVLHEQRAVDVLRRIVACGFSLAQRQQITSTLVEGVACDLADDDIVESILTRLRPPHVDVEIHPTYVATIAPEVRELTQPQMLRSLSASAAVQSDAIAQALFQDLGIRMPPIRLVPRADLPADSFAVRINDLSGVPWRGLRSGEWFAHGTAEYLENNRITFSPCAHPGSGIRCGVVAADQLDALVRLGVQHWDALSHLLVAVGGETRRRAGQLIDADSVAYELGLIAPTHGDIVDAALVRVTVGRLTAILRLLLTGGVPIRDLRGILERVIAFDFTVGDDQGRVLLSHALVLERGYTREPVDRAETYARYIRKTLARVITARAAPNGEVLPVFLMGWEAEQPLLSHLAHLAGNQGGTPMLAGEIESLHDAIAQSIEEVSDVSRWPPIVANAAIAGLLRDALAPEFPFLTVLSFEDLAPGVSLSTVKRIAPV